MTKIFGSKFDDNTFVDDKFLGISLKAENKDLLFS